VNLGHPSSDSAVARRPECCGHLLSPLPRAGGEGQHGQLAGRRSRPARTAELRAAVVLRIETIARSRRSSGRSPAQPASRARISSKTGPQAGIPRPVGLSASRRSTRRTLQKTPITEPSQVLGSPSPRPNSRPTGASPTPHAPARSRPIRYRFTPESQIRERNQIQVHA